MVWDPPKQKVNVTGMIIYSFIPILSIYAGWRIQKFWLLVVINFVVGFGISIPMQMVFPFPYGLIFSSAVVIVIAIYVVKHFAEKYNEKIGSVTEIPKTEGDSSSFKNETSKRRNYQRRI